MKFVFFEIQEWQKQAILDAFPHDEIIFTTEILNESTAHKYTDADIISTFIYSKAPQEVLEQFDHLKLVATRSTGFDHVDHAYGKKNKIYVANVPHYGSDTVAEYTFALILSLSRKIFQTYERTEKLNFSIDSDIQGFDLNGKTLGIYGIGHIGERVTKIAHGFGMKIIGYKRTPDPMLTKNYGVEFVDSISEILKRSDVISFHCPLTKETEHLISMKNYKQIKKGAILVNTARGGLIETKALLKALEEGILSGAGIDVFEGEHSLADPIALLDPNFAAKYNLQKTVENHLLVARDDVILTPHNAFNSIEAVHRILNTTIENIQKFIAGDSKNIVNADW